jgi:hypothetical protein
MKSWTSSIIVGAAAYTVASLSQVSAGGVPPGHVEAIADANDASRTAAVSSSGELATADTAVRASLERFGFDGDSLKVNLQGTGQISGTVSVSNFPVVQGVIGTVDVSNLPATQNVAGTVAVSNLPATQNVNIVGGSVSTNTVSTSHNRGLALSTQLDPSQNNVPMCGGGPITMIAYKADGDIVVSCTKGTDTVLMFFPHGNDIKEFAHPLDVDGCSMFCESDHCTIGYSCAGP